MPYFISFNPHQKLIMEIILFSFICEETESSGDLEISLHMPCMTEAGFKSRYFEGVLFLSSYDT